MGFVVAVLKWVVFFLCGSKFEFAREAHRPASFNQLLCVGNGEHQISIEHNMLHLLAIQDTWLDEEVCALLGCLKHITRSSVLQQRDPHRLVILLVHASPLVLEIPFTDDPIRVLWLLVTDNTVTDMDDELSRLEDY